MACASSCQIVGADCINLARVPFIFAMVIAIVIFSSVLFGTLYACGQQIVDLSDDAHFMGNVSVLKEKTRVWLAENGYVIEELEPTPANSTEVFAAMDVVSSLVSGGVVDSVNSIILTLLLMLMMLGTFNHA